MSLITISGEIQSQSLNDNFSYLDTNKQTKLVTNVKDYGATGDGVTDDTQAINDAIDDAVASGGRIIVIPQGTYLVSSTIEIPHTKTLYIFGDVQQAASFTGTEILRVVGNSLVDGFGFGRILGTGSDNGLIGVLSPSGFRQAIQNLRVEDCETGFKISGDVSPDYNYMHLLQNVVCVDIVNGIVYDGTADIHTCTAVNANVWNATGIAFDVGSAVKNLRVLGGLAQVNDPATHCVRCAGDICVFEGMWTEGGTQPNYEFTADSSENMVLAMSPQSGGSFVVDNGTRNVVLTARGTHSVLNEFRSKGNLTVDNGVISLNSSFIIPQLTDHGRFRLRAKGATPAAVSDFVWLYPYVDGSGNQTLRATFANGVTKTIANDTQA